MSGRIEQRLAELQIELPEAPAPVANYRSFVRHGSLVQLSGAAPSVNGSYLFTGRVGAELSLEQGQAAARLCALNLVAALKKACAGDLDRVQQVMIVRGFVHADSWFEHVPLVINGASDLFVAIFGSEIGRHARTSIGCSALPSQVAVEVDALVVINPMDLPAE